MNELVEATKTFRARIRSTWWMLLAQGILALLVGSLLLTNTDASLRAFAPFLSIYWLVGGVLDILEGIAQRGDDDIWRWSLLGGTLSIVAGLLWLSRILLGAGTLPLWLSMLIAAAAVASGAANIIWAWRLRAKLEGEGWMMLWGAVSIVLGVWIIGAPFISSEMWILLAALFALVSGSGMVIWVGALATQRHSVEHGIARSSKRLPTWLIIGITIAVAAVAAGIWLFGQLQLAAAAPIGVRLSESAQRGQQVFKLHCAMCHNTSTHTKYGPGLAGLFEPGGPVLPGGVNYNGKLSNGKDITPSNEAEWLHTGGRGQVGIMPPVGMGLSDAEVADVIEFLHVLKK
jgi:cytochrome c